MEEPTSEQPAASQEPTSSTASKMAKKQPPRVGLRLCAEEDLAWAIETGFIKNYPPEIYHDHMYAWPGQKYQPGNDDDEVDPPKEEMPPILGNSFQNDLMPDQSEIITEQQETPKITPMKYQMSQMDVVDSGTVFQRSAMSHQTVSSQGPPILHRAGGITMNDAALAASSVGPSQRHQSPTRIPNRQGPPHRNPIGRMVHVSEGTRRAIYAPGQPPQQHAERRVQPHFNESPPPTLIPHRQTVPIVSTSPSRKSINLDEHPEHASIQQPMRRPAILRPTERPQARGGIRSNLPGSHHPASEPLAQQASRSPRKEEVLPMEIKNLAHSLRLNPPSASGTQGEVSPNQQQYKPAMPNDLGRGRIHNPRAMENPKSPDMLPAKPFRMPPPGRQPPGAPGSSSLGGGAMIRAPGSSPIRTNLDFNTQMKVMPASSGVKSNLPPKGRQPASPTKSPSKKRVQKKPKDDDDLEEEIEEDEETDDEDDERVRCICKQDDDLEELGWVQCDQCKCWQHAVCGGYDAIVEAKDRYFCHICQPHANRPNRKTYPQAVEIVKRARLSNKKHQQKGKGPAVNRKPPPEIVRDQPISPPLPSSSSRCTLSSGARIWMKNAGAANDFNGPFSYGSCSKLTVAEQTKGLVANQSIPRGTAVSEIVAHVCKPAEIHSDLDNPLIFKYNRLNISQMPHSKTAPEKVILCLDTRKVAHDGRAVRRCCRPNSTIRHRLSAVLPNFYIVTRQDIEKREEITIAFDSGYRPKRNECRCFGVDDANCLLNDPTFIGPGFMENAAPPVASLPPASPAKNRRREKNEAKVKEEKSEEETPIEPKPQTSRQRTISRSPVKSPRREEREMRLPPSPSRRISERAEQVQEETEPIASLTSPSKKPISPKKATPKGRLSPPASSANKPVERTEPGPSKKVKKSPAKEAKPSTSYVAPAPEAEQPKQEETPKEKKPVGGRRNELDSLNQFNANFAVPSGSTDREKRKLQQELARFGGKTPIAKKMTPKEKPKKSIESEKKSSKIKKPAEIKIEVILPEVEETPIQSSGPGFSKKPKKSISESSSAIAPESLAPGPSSFKNAKVKAEPEGKPFAAEFKKSTESEEAPLAPLAGSSKKAKSQIASPPPEEEKSKATPPEEHKLITPKPSSSKKSKIRAASPLPEEEKIEPSSKKSKTTVQEEVQSHPPAKIEKTRKSRGGSPPPEEEKLLEKSKPEEPTAAGPSKKSSTRAPPPEESLKPGSSKKSKKTIPSTFEEKSPGSSSPKKSKAKAEPEDAPESSKISKPAKRQAPEPIAEESFSLSAGPSATKKAKPEEEKETPSGKVKSTPKAKEPLSTPLASSSKEKKKEKGTPKNKALEKVTQEAGNRTPLASVVPATPASSARPVRNRIPTQKIKEREDSLRADEDRIGSRSRDATPASKARTPAPGPSAVARTKQPKASKTNQSEGTNAYSVWQKLRTGFEQSSKKDFTLFEYLKPTPKTKKSTEKTTKRRREKPQKKKFMRDHLHELFNSSKKRRATKKATKFVKKQQPTTKVNTNRSQRIRHVPGRYRTST